MNCQITHFLLIAKYFCESDVIFLERMFGPWPGIISNYGCGTFSRNLIQWDYMAHTINPLGKY